MAPSFKPPATKSLHKVDQAEGVHYEGRCTIVEGIVAEGQGAWCGMSKGKYDVHCFSFAAWRAVGGSLQRRELLILRPVPAYMTACEQLPRSYFEEFPDYSVQRFSLLLSTDHTRSVFVKAESGAPDQELLLMAEEIREPVAISTKLFGKLRLNRRLSQFEGKTKWKRRSVTIHLESEDDATLQRSLEAAAALWSNQDGWQEKVEKFAVSQLLPLKNESWLEDGDKPLTAKQFLAKTKLTSISVNCDGSFTFWHTAGDLFLGHAVEIRGSLKKGLTSADIPG